MLTDTQCRAARPRDKAYKLTDSGGLVLEVKPNGVKAWRYRSKLTAQGMTKESMFAIGDYAVAPRGETLEQARARRDKDGATTFESVAREWLALKDWEEIPKARRLNMPQRVVFGKIGPLLVKQITPMHILDVLTAAARKNGPSVAAEAKRSMAGVFELAMATLRVDRDPVYPARRALPPNKRPSISGRWSLTRSAACCAT